MFCFSDEILFKSQPVNVLSRQKTITDIYSFSIYLYYVKFVRSCSGNSFVREMQAVEEELNQRIDPFCGSKIRVAVILER